MPGIYFMPIGYNNSGGEDKYKNPETITQVGDLDDCSGEVLLWIKLNFQVFLGSELLDIGLFENGTGLVIPGSITYLSVSKSFLAPSFRKHYLFIRIGIIPWPAFFTLSVPASGTLRYDYPYTHSPAPAYLYTESYLRQHHLPVPGL